VVVFVDASEADEFLEVASRPLESLPYDSPGQTFVAFEKPEGVIATGKFSNILKFIVKEVCVLLAPPHYLMFFYVHFVRISAHEQMEGILDTLATAEISALCLACDVYIESCSVPVFVPFGKMLTRPSLSEEPFLLNKEGRPCMKAYHKT
jgi:hypothetical protein